MWRNKKWKHTDFPSEWVKPPGHLSSAILPLMTTRNQPGRGNDKQSFHVAHKILASDYSLRSLVLPGPSGIEDLLIVLVLNLYPLGINPMSPFGCIYHDCSQLNPFDSNDFSCHCCLHKAGSHHLFHLGSVTWNFRSINNCSMKRAIAEQFLNNLSFLCRKGKN